jgi:hypothetical protein
VSKVTLNAVLFSLLCFKSTVVCCGAEYLGLLVLFWSQWLCESWAVMFEKHCRPELLALINVSLHNIEFSFIYILVLAMGTLYAPLINFHVITAYLLEADVNQLSVI